MSRITQRITVSALACLAVIVLLAPGSVWAQSWTGADLNGQWSDPANWLNGVAPNPSSLPVFSDPSVIAGQNTITLPSGETDLAGLTFNTNLNQISLNDEGDGTSFLSLAGGPATISVSGTHSINVPVQLLSPLNVTTSAATDSLTISGSLSGGAGAPVSLGGAGGTLNLTTNGTAIDQLYIAAGNTVAMSGTGSATINNLFPTYAYVNTGVAAGNFVLTSGMVTTGSNGLDMSHDYDGGAATMVVSGGTMNVTGLLEMGFNMGSASVIVKGNGVLNASGQGLQVGVANVRDGYVGLFGNAQATFGSVDLYDGSYYGEGGTGSGVVMQVANSAQLTTGSLNVGDGFVYDAGRGHKMYGSAQLYQSGGTVTVNGPVGIALTQLSSTYSFTGTYNLNGGLLQTTGINNGSATVPGTANVNFHGGTLKYNGSAPQSDFIKLGPTGSAYIYEGVTIDDGGKAVTINQPLLSPNSGQGLAPITLSAPIGNYPVTPEVDIEGGGGSGATAVAVLNAAGQVTGITVTNPGVGYTLPPTVSLSYQGNETAVPASAVTLNGGNAYSGGLTKIGTGTLTLTASNTYTGGTKISSGVLAVANASALGSGAVNLAGGTLRLAGVVTANSSPGSIGIKFASGEDASTGLPASTNGIAYPVTGTAGVVQQANWNNVYNNAGSQGSLLNSSGETTSASVSWSAPSTFSVWVPGNSMISPTPPLTAPANPNDQLTNSYLCNYAPQTVWDGSYTGLAPRGTPAVNVNISGIPYASYKVYVYFDGAPWGGQATWYNSGNTGGDNDGGVTVAQGASSQTFYYQSINGANAYGPLLQAQNAGFGYAIPGGFYYGTANSADGSGSPGANFAEYESLSGGSVQVSQFVSALNDGGLQDDSGITAVQIVGDPIPTAYSPTALANAVNVTANSTLDVTGASTASVGNLAIGGNTLSVTGGGSGPNSNYFLTAGATHLTGNATFNVANNGTGEGTLTLGSVDQDGTPRSLTKVGAGMLVLSGTDTYTGGTTVLAGTLVVGNASGLETGTSLTVGTWPAGGGGGGTAAPAGAEVSAVPEPGTSALLLSALVAAACLWRRRKQG